MTNKNYISRKIALNSRLSMKESKNFLDFFISIIKDNAKSRKIKLSRFGTFEYKKTPKRMGRNPKTIESYIIPIMKKLNFKASNKLKNFIN